MIYKKLLTLCIGLMLVGVSQSFAQVEKNTANEAILKDALSNNTCWAMYTDKGKALKSNISPEKSTIRKNNQDFLAVSINGKTWTVEVLQAKRLVIKKNNTSMILVPCK